MRIDSVAHGLLRELIADCLGHIENSRSQFHE